MTSRACSERRGLDDSLRQTSRDLFQQEVTLLMGAMLLTQLPLYNVSSSGVMRTTSDRDVTWTRRKQNDTYPSYECANTTNS